MNITVNTATELYRKYIGAGEVDLIRLRDFVRQDCHRYETGIQKCTPGLLTEIRHHRAIIGQLCNRAEV